MPSSRSFSSATPHNQRLLAAVALESTGTLNLSMRYPTWGPCEIWQTSAPAAALFTSARFDFRLANESATQDARNRGLAQLITGLADMCRGNPDILGHSTAARRYLGNSA